MTLKLNFLFFFGLVQFWFKNDLIRDEFFINEDRDFLALFFAFRRKKILTILLKKNERPRERTTTSTTENEDDNHDGTSRDAKPNDGGRDPVGRGRFGTTGDE